MVLAHLVLHKVSHLRKLCLTLRLQALDEVGHLNVLFFRSAKLLAQLDSHLISMLLVALDHIQLSLDILEGQNHRVRLHFHAVHTLNSIIALFFSHFLGTFVVVKSLLLRCLLLLE